MLLCRASPLRPSSSSPPHPATCRSLTRFARLEGLHISVIARLEGLHISAIAVMLGIHHIGHNKNNNMLQMLGQAPGPRTQLRLRHSEACSPRAAVHQPAVPDEGTILVMAYIVMAY